MVFSPPFLKPPPSGFSFLKMLGSQLASQSLMQSPLWTTGNQILLLHRLLSNKLEPHCCAGSWVSFAQSHQSLTGPRSNKLSCSKEEQFFLRFFFVGDNRVCAFALDGFELMTANLFFLLSRTSEPKYLQYCLIIRVTAEFTRTCWWTSAKTSWWTSALQSLEISFPFLNMLSRSTGRWDETTQFHILKDANVENMVFLFSLHFQTMPLEYTQYSCDCSHGEWMSKPLQ